MFLDLGRGSSLRLMVGPGAGPVQNQTSSEPLDERPLNRTSHNQPSENNHHWSFDHVTRLTGEPAGWRTDAGEPSGLNAPGRRQILNLSSRNMKHVQELDVVLVTGKLVLVNIKHSYWQNHSYVDHKAVQKDDRTVLEHLSNIQEQICILMEAALKKATRWRQDVPSHPDPSIFLPSSSLKSECDTY